MKEKCMSNKIMMSIKDIKKTYQNSKFTLGPVSIDIKEGECISILGKNGSGKTTFFQSITGNLDISDGQILFKEKKLTPDKWMLKREIGYLPQHLELPQWVTGKEILNYSSKLHQIKNSKERIAQLMEYWDCNSYSHKPLAALSHGMQKRIALALATIHKPDFLVLDEPFSGLDLQHIKNLQKEIIERGKEGKTTIVCTHIIPYAALLCHRAFILKQGNFKKVSDWEELDQIERNEKAESLFFRDEPEDRGNRC